jgi:hypothetical protein
MVAYVDTEQSARYQAEVARVLAPLQQTEAGEAASSEQSIMDGIDLMRRTLDACRKWWEFLLQLRHGSPYDAKQVYSSDTEQASAHELARSVDMATLHRAEVDLDNLIYIARKQITEVGNQSGQKNVRFVLEMFIDDCMLRKEKIIRIRSTRQLVDIRQDVQLNPGYAVTDFSNDFMEDIKKLADTQRALRIVLQEVRNQSTHDATALELQHAIVMTLESKVQLCDTQIELSKARVKEPSDPFLPSLRIIKDRWSQLKRFSLYNLYQRSEQEKWEFNNDDEMMSHLVQISDEKIDAIIVEDKERVISRDALIPALCYDLLLENAELRKMCNACQLKILVFYKGSVPDKRK